MILAPVVVRIIPGTAGAAEVLLSLLDNPRRSP
jgi:hypothetical protein